VWGVKTGKIHSGLVLLVYSSDEYYFVSGSKDKTVFAPTREIAMVLAQARQS
jgi:hypothetical protein